MSVVELLLSSFLEDSLGQKKDWRGISISSPWRSLGDIRLILGVEGEHQDGFLAPSKSEDLDRLPQPHSYLLVEHQKIEKTIYMFQIF